MSKRKILIDTDAVADDIRAISVALQHPNVEVCANFWQFYMLWVQVVGITTVRGCVEVEQAVANVARTLKANGKTNVTTECDLFSIQPVFRSQFTKAAQLRSLAILTLKTGNEHFLAKMDWAMLPMSFLKLQLTTGVRMCQMNTLQWLWPEFLRKIVT